MAQDLFLFNGGNYKRGMEDGRVRVPLSCVEGQSIHLDPEMTGLTGNSIADTIHLSKYPELDSLAVDDRIYIAVLPDATVYRGIWGMAQDAYPGLTFTLDLVSVCDVATAIRAGNDPATVTSMFGASASVDVTAATGLGDATKDAAEKAYMTGDAFSDYRDVGALAHSMFVQRLAPLGEALYVRMTITALPAAPLQDHCGACGDNVGLPALQFGVMIEDIGIDKQRVADFCRCKARICAGDCCPSGAGTADNGHAAAPSAPAGTVPGDTPTS